jgi:hypothetical protein
MTGILAAAVLFFGARPASGAPAPDERPVRSHRAVLGRPLLLASGFSLVALIGVAVASLLPIYLTLILHPRRSTVV